MKKKNNSDSAKRSEDLDLALSYLANELGDINLLLEHIHALDMYVDEFCRLKRKKDPVTTVASQENIKPIRDEIRAIQNNLQSAIGIPKGKIAPDILILLLIRIFKVHRMVLSELYDKCEVEQLEKIEGGLASGKARKPKPTDWLVEKVVARAESLLDKGANRRRLTTTILLELQRSEKPPLWKGEWPPSRPTVKQIIDDFVDSPEK